MRTIEPHDTFGARLDEVRARIKRAARRVGRDPAGITLVAVSKTVPFERLREAASHGCRIFGESRVQEAMAKMEAIMEGGLTWHFIGPIQTNKVKHVVGRFALLHAVDRIEVAERIDRTARERGVVQPVLLEVNVAGEETKHGFAPADVPAAAERLRGCAGIAMQGLMAIPPHDADPEAARPHFRKLRELSVEAGKSAGVPLPTLSMGMSDDFEVAVEEGATLVRIGTALFGER